MTQSSLNQTTANETIYGDAEAHLIDIYYVSISVPLSSISSMTLSRKSEKERQHYLFLMIPTERRELAPRISTISELFT